MLALWFLLRLVGFGLDKVSLLVIWSECVTHCLLVQPDKDKSQTFEILTDSLKFKYINNCESVMTLKSQLQIERKSVIRMMEWTNGETMVWRRPRFILGSTDGGQNNKHLIILGNAILYNLQTPFWCSVDKNTAIKKSSIYSKLLLEVQCRI